MSLTQINEQFRQLQQLLKMEKEEDFERFRREVLQLSLSEKVEKGLCWSPVDVKKEGFSMGERAFIIVERSAKRDVSHRFKPGAPVEFYSRASDKFDDKQKSQTGVIQFIEKNRMKIIFNSRDIPDWLHLGYLAVDLLFDERTYIEMDKALALLLKTNDGRLAELKSIFYGDLQPLVSREKVEVYHPLLNDSQIRAVQNILAAQDVAVIHGPPGTGKTTTLIHAIKMMCETEKQILVTAPSNAAVDLLAQRLSEKGLNVVRVGNISRVDPELISLTVEGRLAAHTEHKHIKKIRIQAAQARRDAQKFKRKFGAQEREERRDAYREFRDLEDWARQLEDKIISEILFSADVIACTLVNATHPLLSQIKFHTVVIDEAAQALEPAGWIPITRAHKVVFAGDPFQLPPTVKSQKAKKEGLEITLLEKLVKRLSLVNFLDVQYRMNAKIMGFSNARFYGGQLKASELVTDWQLPLADNTPVVFIDTAGCGFEEERNPETLSSFNKGEHFILREHLLKMLNEISAEQLAETSVAIISPYRAQCLYIEEELKEEEQFSAFLEQADINTIDAFQGQERDLIYISLVRSNENAEIGFLADYRRMNVAMTRARKQLVVIGDSATIGADDFYRSFLEYVEKHGDYRSAWEFMG